MDYIKKNALVSKFQKLIYQDEMPSLKTFEIEVNFNFIIFPVGELEKIYVFIEIMQNKKNRGRLSDALKNMFKMLIDHIIGHDTVTILNERNNKKYYMLYKNIFKEFNRKKIYQQEYGLYTIPYNPTGTKRRNAHPEKYGLESYNAYELENYTLEDSDDEDGKDFAESLYDMVTFKSKRCRRC